MRIVKTLIAIMALSLMMFSCEEEIVNPLLGTWQTSMGQQLDTDAADDMTSTFTLTFTAGAVTWDTDVTLSVDLDGDMVDDQGDWSCSSAGTWSDDGSVVTLNLSDVATDDDEGDDEGDDDDGPPACLQECEGWDDTFSETAACEWLDALENGLDNACMSGCDEDTMAIMAEHAEYCTECLADESCDDEGEDEEGDEGDDIDALVDAYLAAMLMGTELCPSGDALTSAFTISGDTLDLDGLVFTRQ